MSKRLPKRAKSLKARLAKLAAQGRVTLPRCCRRTRNCTGASPDAIWARLSPPLRSPRPPSTAPGQDLRSMTATLISPTGHCTPSAWLQPWRCSSKCWGDRTPAARVDVPQSLWSRSAPPTGAACGAASCMWSSSAENHIDTAHHLDKVPWWQLGHALGEKGSIDGDDLRRIGHRILLEARSFGG